MIKDFQLTFNSIGLLVSQLTKLLRPGNKKYRVNIVEWRERRSLDQNSLYWKWLTEIDQQSPLKVDGSNINGNELWHEIFKKYYCPEKVITNNRVNVPTKSTKFLDVGEFHHYLNKIEYWCMERGITLTIPDACEYSDLKAKQDE
jgi:hypothetical protein